MALKAVDEPMIIRAKVTYDDCDANRVERDGRARFDLFEDARSDETL